MNYFTSDTHFGHKNILKYCNRPYGSVKEMDEALIENWNSVVKPKDDVWHLGDVSFQNADYTVNVLSQLNGNIHLIRGNHDMKMSDDVYKMFSSVRFYHELYVQDKDAPRGRQHIVLLHYAMRVWNKSHHGSWQLYGHSHGSLPDDPSARSIDVGVDSHNYTPISYDQIKEIMANKTYESVDHH